jgi:hypothetical protein
VFVEVVALDHLIFCHQIAKPQESALLIRGRTTKAEHAA